MVAHLSHSCTTAQSYKPLCTLFVCVPPCVPPRTRFTCPNVPTAAPTGHPKAPKWPYIGQSGTKVRSKWIHIAQSSSKWVKHCQNVPQAAGWVPPLVLIRQIWPEKGPKGPFSAKFARFSDKIGSNWINMGQNGFQRGPKGSKCHQQRANLYQNALNWLPSGLKCHQHPLKWVKTGSRGVPRGPKGSKMASKWPQIPQNGLFQAKFG